MGFAEWSTAGLSASWNVVAELLIAEGYPLTVGTLLVQLEEQTE